MLKEDAELPNYAVSTDCLSGVSPYMSSNGVKLANIARSILGVRTIEVVVQRDANAMVHAKRTWSLVKPVLHCSLYSRLAAIF
jgi:hypothetical protein